MRLPDFVILGAMKAGTTSLFRWLEQHPDVAMPRDKEPAFFSREENWQRGVESYAQLFADIPSAKLAGEASVHYSDPAVAERSAERLAQVVPKVRLIFVARDPAERLRSHYRHQVQRGREKRPLLQALGDADSAYVRCSLYDDALRPYARHFGRERLLLLDFTSLTASERGFERVLEFLGLTPVPRPREAHNVTSDKRGFSPLMRFAYDHGFQRFEKRLPRALRNLLKPLAFRSGGRLDTLLASAKAPLPAPIQQRLDESFGRLRQELGPLL